MNKNNIFIALALVAVIVIGAVFIINNLNKNTKSETNNSPVNSASDNSTNQVQGEVKEFKMDSFYEIVDGQPKPQYSLKEITVKKGDTVRIEVTVTKGSHDFNIDEYNINVETPLNQPTIIEFKADKVGKFIYYCSRPGHRENGQWGALIITE